MLPSDQAARLGACIGLVPALLLCAAACEKRREERPDARCATWQEDIAPLVAEQCTGCHSGESPAGGYDLTSYLGALGGGSDGTPNTLAGDDDSRILTILSDDSDEIHRAFSEVREPLEEWVDTCGAGYFRSRIHPPGIMNPRDDDFHGELLADTNYDFESCGNCHGSDFSGGESGASCLTCHPQGPADCTTCHGTGPVSAAHPAHLAPEDALPVECETCHVVPTDWRDPGHVLRADGERDPPPAEVRFTALAARGTPDVAPSFDPASGRCSDVYCHGDPLADAGGSDPEPEWREGSGPGTCGACHGIPPPDHGDQSGERCGRCHESAADGPAEIRLPALHVNGILEVEQDANRCNACHGNGENSAPPVDLDGASSPALVTVGAHQAHLTGDRRLSPPVPCSACHLVPEEIGSPGHVDTPRPAEVFPGEISAVSLAFAGNAEPEWNRETERCDNTYCHGGGPTLSQDPSENIIRDPLWTAGRSQVYCGSCHGIPPEDGVHDPEWPLTECSRCHGTAVDPFGNIILSGEPGALTSRHINGQVDP